MRQLFSHEIGKIGVEFPAHHGGPWPLPSVWLGVSVTNQADADARIPHLLRCSAAVRWLSCEPLLGKIRVFDPGCPHAVQTPLNEVMPGGGIDWLVVGAQSGAGNRETLFDVDWARSLRDQCAAARVAFAFKNPTGFPPLDGVVHSALPSVPHA
jgi:protein gp37